MNFLSLWVIEQRFLLCPCSLMSILTVLSRFLNWAELVIYQLAVLSLNVLGDRETLCQPQEHTEVTSFHPSTVYISGVCDIAALTRNRNHDSDDNLYAEQSDNCILCLGRMRICGITCMLYWVENVKYLVEGCLSKIWDQANICYHGEEASWNEELGLLFSIQSFSYF
jgi:hypothetical protein